MMKRMIGTIAAASAVFAAACSDSQSTSAPSSALEVSMASAYSTTPAGYNGLTSSYDASGSFGAFAPPEFEHDANRGHGHGFGPLGIGPGFGIGFMGGGLGGLFLGDGLGRFHDDDDCTFSAMAGETCTDTTRDGLIAQRIAKYTTAAGVVQQKIDSLTNTVTTSISVSGTATRRDSTTSVVNESSTQTVSGLAKGSTQRTVDGASKGSENTTGTSKEGAFTATRVVGDTITGIVLPVPTSVSSFLKSYPTAGTIIRAMSATVTIDGQSPATSSRREVITYDGSATAKVVITQDGTTQNCTLPLPHGRLSCSQ